MTDTEQSFIIRDFVWWLNYSRAFAPKWLTYILAFARGTGRNVRGGHSCFSVRLHCQQVVIYRHVAAPVGEVINGYRHDRQTVIPDRQPVGLRFAAVAAPDPVGPLYQRVPPQPVVLLFGLLGRSTTVLFPTRFNLGGQFVPIFRLCRQTVHIVSIGPLGYLGPDGVQVDLILHFVHRKHKISVCTATKVGLHSRYIVRQNALELILAALSFENLDTGIAELVRPIVAAP